ncbi:flagellar assembly protein FliW [Lentibacillus salicampi]|uniref:Flagellar assembly factor FliW n=1 Tax=Lentibacillus salicampi TaxID=175306 RepID=A0A4Y9ACZ4_9BACI|nr:flagellar assembly protein FliW [Lentibacillus salicampi]TFJ93305.1 flagellar assembly protein FliW [Lentibacillus salicampi]
MHIQTKYFGEMSVDTTKTIQFPSGLPGFVDENEFVLFNLSETSVYQILQSTRNKGVAFIVVNPYVFYQDYVIDLDDHLMDSLQIKDDQDVAVLSIVTVKDPFDTSTMNLKAPVIINSQTNRGKQYILNSDAYPSKAAITPQDSSLVKGE